MMIHRGIIIQFAVAVAVAASSAWLAQTWRQEGAEFVAQQEKRGGIEKERLGLEARKKKAEIIESYEAEGREERGRIEGQAATVSKTIEEQGELGKTTKLNVGTQAQGFAIDALRGLDLAASRFEHLAESGEESERETNSKIARYLRRAARAHEKLRSLSWSAGSNLNCSDAQAQAEKVASVLNQKVDDSSNPDIFKGEGWLIERLK